MIQFTENDLTYLQNRGSDPEKVEKQFSYFFKGFPYARLNRIATISDGIVQLNNQKLDHFIQYYDQQCGENKVTKFVPASGAASRMFKDLYDALKSDGHVYEPKVEHFLHNLKKLPFYPDLQPFIKSEDPREWIEKLLTEKGLNYGNLPKAVLKFHHYEEENRTAIEEHLVEAALYAKSGNGDCYIHFTVSPNHLDGIKDLIQKVQPIYSQRFGVEYHISYSIQNPSTDTLAAEMDNTPFRDKSGDLLFRPGGHGALISNLNVLDSDLIFIKNIDNVITENKLESTIVYKKACAGLLLELRNKTYEYLQLIDNQSVHDDLYCSILDFAKYQLCIQFQSETPTLAELKMKLNRPIRVCGMVKNEREPGGGPFWVTNTNRETSCQIVETSQIDKQDSQQMMILQNATHFNPVDMVCSTKDYQGNKFDLLQYIDHNTGFISEKSYEGRTLKAMELPGLWNGAMADWITIFVEVPLETFNPVKTIFDLLKR